MGLLNNILTHNIKKIGEGIPQVVIPKMGVSPSLQMRAWSIELGFPHAHSMLTPSRGMLYLSLSPSWNCCLESTKPQFFRGNVDNHAEAPFSDSRAI